MGKFWDAIKFLAGPADVVERKEEAAQPGQVTEAIRDILSLTTSLVSNVDRIEATVEQLAAVRDGASVGYSPMTDPGTFNRVLFPRLPAFQDLAYREASAACEAAGLRLDDVTGIEARGLSDTCEERGHYVGAALLRYLSEHEPVVMPMLSNQAVSPYWLDARESIDRAQRLTFSQGAISPNELRQGYGLPPLDPDL